MRTSVHFVLFATALWAIALLLTPAIASADDRTLADFERIAADNFERALNGEVTLWNSERLHATHATIHTCLHGVTSLTPGEARIVAMMDGTLHLPDLTSINAEVAGVLVHGRDVDLSSVRTVTIETAAELGQASKLRVGFATLEPAVARAMAAAKNLEAIEFAALRTWTAEAGQQFSDETKFSLPAVTSLDGVPAGCRRVALDFAGLTTLSEDAARRLAAISVCHLSLPNVTALSPEAARALMGNPLLSRLTIGLESLSDETAAELCIGSWYQLRMDRLTSLSPAAARAIGEAVRGELSLDGLTTVEDGTLAGLTGNGVAKLSLDGLTSLTDDQCREIKSRGLNVLSLGGLQRVPSGLPGEIEELYLPGVTALNDDDVNALRDLNGKVLYLDGVTSITRDAAGWLIRGSWNVISLYGLEQLSDEVASLLGKSRARLHAPNVVPSSVAQATSIAHWKPWGGGFYRITRLDAEMAAALATTKSDLDLPAMRELPADVARALSRYQGGNLALRGLANLTVEAARELAAYGGRTLWVGGTLPADPAVYAALAESRAEILRVGVRAITPECAAALAAFDREYLRLGIKTIDAATVKALESFVGERIVLDELVDFDDETGRLLAEPARRFSVWTSANQRIRKAESDRSTWKLQGQFLTAGRKVEVVHGFEYENTEFQRHFHLHVGFELLPETVRERGISSGHLRVTSAVRNSITRNEGERFTVEHEEMDISAVKNTVRLSGGSRRMQLAREDGKRVQAPLWLSTALADLDGMHRVLAAIAEHGDWTVGESITVAPVLVGIVPPQTGYRLRVTYFGTEDDEAKFQLEAERTSSADWSRLYGRLFIGSGGYRVDFAMPVTESIIEVQTLRSGRMRHTLAVSFAGGGAMPSGEVNPGQYLRIGMQMGKRVALKHVGTGEYIRSTTGNQQMGPYDTFRLQGAEFLILEVQRDYIVVANKLSETRYRIEK